MFNFRWVVIRYWRPHTYGFLFPPHHSYLHDLPAFPVLLVLVIIPLTRGRLASTGLMKELQRVQVPGPWLNHLE
jgi:hypothetical protein